MDARAHCDKRHCLDAQQIALARLRLADGWSPQSTADEFGLTVQELQSALSLPQWKSLPPVDRTATRGME